jgi:hypothetical protein
LRARQASSDSTIFRGSRIAAGARIVDCDDAQRLATTQNDPALPERKELKNG